MCDSQDDDKKSAANPEQKTSPKSSNSPISTSPEDHAFKKPSNPPRISATKKSLATTQKSTVVPASKRSSPAPTPPASKKPSPPIGSPSAKPFPPPTPPPSPPPTPPPTPPSPPKPASLIPVLVKKTSALDLSPAKKISSSPKAPPPKRSTSLPQGQSSSPSKIPISRSAAPRTTIAGSVLAQMLAPGPPPGTKKPPPPPPPPSSRLSPSIDAAGERRNDVEYQLNKLMKKGIVVTKLQGKSSSLVDSCIQNNPEFSGDAPVTVSITAVSPTGSRENIDCDHQYSKKGSRTSTPKKKGPRTPPGSPAYFDFELQRPERPQNPAFGRPAPSLRVLTSTVRPGEIITLDGVHYEAVTILDDLITKPASSPAASTPLAIPPPFTTSRQCLKCKEFDRKKCKNCHQLQPICRMCPICEKFRHFACFEDGCYNPADWFEWVCRHCRKRAVDAQLEVLLAKQMHGPFQDEYEGGKVFSENQGKSADKENTPPSSNTKKKRLKLDVPQMFDYTESTSSPTKKFKKSTPPSEEALTPNKSPLTTTESPSTPKKTPTKSPLQESKSPASSSRPFSVLREISPSAQGNRILSSPKTPTSRKSFSSKASTPRISSSPNTSTSRMSASPKASTPSRFSSVLQESNRMSLSPRAPASRMSLSPTAPTSSASVSPEASLSRMCVSPNPGSPNASLSTMFTSPKSSKSRITGKALPPKLYRKASSSRTFASPEASSSRMSVNPGPSSSRMSVNPGPSSSRMSVNPGPSSSRMSVNPGPSSSRMSVNPGPSTSRMPASPEASTSNTATPEETERTRQPLSLDFNSPQEMVIRNLQNLPEIPGPLGHVVHQCRYCHRTQPIMRRCFTCDMFVNGFVCKLDECLNQAGFREEEYLEEKIDLYWYCYSCIRNLNIPRLSLENFCYACLTPMPLAKKCHNCGKFYTYRCDFPYKCIVTHYPSYMMFSRWNHCAECLDAGLGKYAEPLEVANLTTDLEPWYTEIISISVNVYNVSPVRNHPSVKRTLNLDEEDNHNRDFKRMK